MSTRARVMAPDASIRRPTSSAAAAAVGGDSKGANADLNSNATSAESSPTPSPSPASKLVAPSSIASGFAKFTHKGEDTWSNCTGLRVDVPGTERGEGE